MRLFVHTGTAMQKAERQKLILELISASAISRQDELADKLRLRGFEVTQASVSRDLDELGVVKVNGRYSRLVSGQNETNPFGVRLIEAAGDNLIVIRCASGLASAVAVRIDGAGIGEIVGTIAGDDTIFVAARDRKDRKSAQRKIRMLLAE